MANGTDTSRAGDGSRDKKVQVRGGAHALVSYGDVMTRALSTVTDGELVAGLKALVVKERGLSAAMLEHLGEVDARKLYLPAACSSMVKWCVKVLGMAEQVAYKRIRAARVARRFSVVLEAVAEGRLNLSAVVLIAPALTEENAAELVAEVSGMSQGEIGVVLARRTPKPDVPDKLEREPQQGALVDSNPVAPPPKAKVLPLAPARYSLEVTLSGATKDKLERAQALLRHLVPSGDLAQVIECALEALLEKIEARKFGKGKGPRVARKSGSRRHVPMAVRREVVARDGERCAFVGEDGRRCDEAGFLELDHVVPVARGGESTVEGVRVLCRAHNRYEAERLMGREVVEAGRAARQMEADMIAGLKRMGVAAADARHAVAESRGQGSTIEERMRAALSALHAIYARQKGWRCQEGRLPYGAASQRPDLQTAASGMAQRQRMPRLQVPW